MQNHPGLEIHVVRTLADISADEWNHLAGNQPFLSYAFLSALELSGCAIAETGWQAYFILGRVENELVAAMPLYLKSHSYGEYVFDWAWANAYNRIGLAYYPKLLCAIPFTPVTGMRLLTTSTRFSEDLIRTALQLAQQLQVSSLHCLFPDASQMPALQAAGMLARSNVQFHWNNPGYADFGAYLSSMNNPKRKKIKQERRHVQDAGIHFEHILGSQASVEQWKFFYQCYEHTYHTHHSTPYLNLNFFQRIATSMGQHILLVIAWREDKMIACALNIFTEQCLYGRYWGALEVHSGLHFETCYYQAIEFCIAQGIKTFEGGAQGEHKLARGFLPVVTHSAHWLAHQGLGRAVEDFLQREHTGLEQYASELNERSPFKSV